MLSSKSCDLYANNWDSRSLSQQWRARNNGSLTSSFQDLCRTSFPCLLSQNLKRQLLFSPPPPAFHALSALTMAPITRQAGALPQGHSLKTKSLTQFTSFDRLASGAKMGDYFVSGYSCKWQVCPSSSLRTPAFKKYTRPTWRAIHSPRGLAGRMPAQWERLEREIPHRREQQPEQTSDAMMFSLAGMATGRKPKGFSFLFFF